MQRSRTRVWLTLLLALMATQLAGCSLVTSLFKAGLWAGVLAIAVCAALFFAATRRMRD